MDELSSAFYRSCLAVRQSGEELSEVKSYLLKELLSIAITRSVRANRQQQEAEETVRTLQVCCALIRDSPYSCRYPPVPTGTGKAAGVGAHPAVWRAPEVPVSRGRGGQQPRRRGTAGME